MHAAVTAGLVLCALAFGPRLDRGAAADYASVRTLLEQGRYQEAETAARRLYLTGIEAAESVEDLRAGDLLVEALVRNGRSAGQETRALAHRIVERRAAASGRGGSELATSLRNLGDVLFESGEYPPAIARYREALQLREQLPGAATDNAEDLDHLARALTYAEVYGEAAVLCERALARREPAAATDGPGFARSLLVRGSLHQRMGDYAAALSDFERAAAILDRWRPAHPQTAEALALLGEQLVASGRPLKADEVLVRAVSVATAALRPEHPAVASALGSRAVALQELGDMAGSLEVRQRAVAIAEAAYGPDHPKVAIQLNDLANTFLLQGDYARARALYERARATYERRLGADHIGASTASYNLALLNVKLGDFAEARRGLLSVLATCERTLGPENPNVARASSALAGLLANHGFDREAQPYFERALAIRKRQLGSEHPYVAVTLSAWAASLARSGQLARAHELSRRALGIWEAAGARDMLADGLVDHARIQLRRGELADAERAYRKALDLRTGLLGSSHPSIAEAEGGLATVLIRLDERGEAFERALRADEIGRTHARLTLASLSERQALDYASSRPAGLDIALSILPDTAAGRPLAYDALIRGRALTLDEMASRRGLRGTEQAQDVSPLWDALTSARQRLANLVTRGPASASPQQYGALVESARRDKESAERALAERSAAFRSQLARADVGLAQVAAALPDDTALVSYVRFDRIVRGDDDRSVPEQVRRTQRSSCAPVRPLPPSHCWSRPRLPNPASSAGAGKRPGDRGARPARRQARNADCEVSERRSGALSGIPSPDSSWE